MKRIIVLFGLIFVVFFAAYGQESISEIVVPGNSLTRKFDWILSNAENGKTYVIILDRDETLPNGQNLFYDGREITIILRGRGAMRRISTVNTDNIFQVRSGVSFVLEEYITIYSQHSFDLEIIPVTIEIGIGGTMVMKNNTAVIGGFGLQIDGGTLIMSGGTISGSLSNGVSINGGRLDMNSGSITGVIPAWGMSPAVVVNDGNFTMNGGSISGNEMTGVAIYNGNFIMRNGFISGNGGGVYIAGGTFTMTGGSITGNISTVYEHGFFGGVYIGSGVFNLNSPASKASISGNFGQSFGSIVRNNSQVYVSGGVFRVNGLLERSY